MLKFWKSDREKFEEEMSKAFDARNKGKIDDAIEHFMKAYEIAAKSKEENLRGIVNVPLSYALVYKALSTGRPSDIEEARKAVSSLPPDSELDLALPKKVKAGELAEDFKYLALLYSTPEINLSKLSNYSPGDASKLEEVGKVFVSAGSRKFVIEDLVKIHDTFESIGYKLLAFSKMITAKQLEEEDPDKAVEVYSEALGYLGLAANVDEFVKRVNDRINKLSKATRCWICGRPIQGEEVHFLYLDTFTTKYILKKYSGEDELMMREGKVAVCAVCYGTIYMLSDKISKRYYERAMEEMRRLEERLMAQISALRAEIEMLRVSVSSIRVGYRRSGPDI
ncbi:hypothetical protein TCELL_0008 [Thermogladius calderae 1633]|uniref:Uncharacterized protein n=1 Tax=Thermogladius calderae (strain DSM 22663 / VKM B-2946 / 1633) TaxID=1184251 RepID=I3TCE5_THEC1|nr:hypothetical protein [Thermogladius calderae]AFK50433.1 hypothetical protein TCELL_0008 [Thermogladius calderae 1633]